MRNRITYTNGLIILVTALLGWLVGYYVRWDKSNQRPYIEYRNGPRVTVETVGDETADAVKAEDLQDDESKPGSKSN